MAELSHTRTSNLQPRFAWTNLCTTSASSGRSDIWHCPIAAQSAMLVDQVSICDRPCEFYEQPAAYYPSMICWLFLISVYTFGKTHDTF